MLLGGITVLSAAAAVLACLCSGAFGGLSWLWVLPAGFAASWLALFALAFLLLLLICSPVKLDRPQEHDSRFYRRVTHLYIDAVFSIVRLRIHTQGLEKTPEDGRFMLVCNHQQIADPVVLLAAFPQSRLAFISKQENQRLFIVGKLMHKLMCQPLDRQNDRKALKTIVRCIQLLKDDEVSIGVFPEGYTSKDGKLHPFRSGVFKIAQKANVPIVVCTIQGTRPLFQNLLRLKRTEVQLHLVDVIPPEVLKGHTAIEIGDRIHEMMLSDLGEGYRPEE